MWSALSCKRKQRYIKINLLLLLLLLLWTTYAGRRVGSTHSTWEASAVSWVYPGSQSNQHWCPVSCWSSQYVHSTSLRQRRLRWLGHVRRMEDGRIPKGILCGELALGRRTTGHPHLRYKEVCVRDMKAVGIDTMSWEGLAAERTKWRSALKQHLKTGQDKLMTDAADKRARTKEDSSSMTCLVYMSWCK